MNKTQLQTEGCLEEKRSTSDYEGGKKTEE